MRVKKYNIQIKLASVLALTFFLSACGAEYAEADPLKSAITLLADGSVDCVLREDFAQSYYSEEELVSYTQEKIDAYNGAYGAERVQLTAHQAQNSIAALALHFASAEDYAAFMGQDMYCGDLQGAYEHGVSFDQALSFAQKPERVIGKNELMNMASERVLVISGDMSITLPQEPDYYTFGMLRTGEKSLEAQGEGVYFMIY